MRGRAGRTVFPRLVLATAVITAVSAGAVATAADWPQFRSDPTHSGSNPSESAINPANVGSLAPTWTATTGGVIHSSPAVANGSAYVGSDDGKLYAFDAAGMTNCTPGTPRACGPLWTGATGGFVRSSPAVAKGLVYAASDDGRVYAFDAAGLDNCAVGPPPRTCLAQWVTTTAGIAGQSPTVADGMVYVGSNDTSLYALDATTGQILWKTFTGGTVGSTPAVAGGVVYVGSDDKKVYALNATTGQVLWSTSTGSPVRSSPAVVNGVVYVGSLDSSVYALNATTGQILWATVTGSLVFSSPAVANGVVYVGSQDGRLYALDAATGAVRWTAAASTLRTSPAVANGLVYVGGGDGPLAVFDAAGSINCGGAPKTCAPLRVVPTGGAVTSGPLPSSPAVANGTVYVGSADHKLYAMAPFQPPPCTRSLTGDVAGPVTVPAGESVCITNARVVGPVTVQTGGALSVAGSRITNGVVATGPSFFSLCGSQVAAPIGNPSQGVVVSGAGVPLTIGDPSAGCAGNRVAGNVSLIGNTAGVTVAANIVSGTLACSGNNPPPTNGGQPNTAGAKTGQCAGL